MPPKKKKGKASKLARMTDEERARYLQHRADMELEAKRRKQQLVACFAKNKLKREEAFARINAAKLNEQWRTTLRQMKCVELKEEVQHMWKNFEEELQTKDDFIKRLYGELVDADYDHRRFQEAHMMALDDIIEKGKERIDYLHNNYEDAVERIRTVDIEELKIRKVEMTNSLLHLKSILFAKHKSLEKELMDIKTRNAINIYSFVFSKEESILNLKRKIYPELERLWQQLNDVITIYEESTETKWKQYEYLKEQDDAHQAEAALFPKIFAHLKESLETMRKRLARLAQEREETIEDLRGQSELLTKRVCKMRQEMKMAQTVDEVQLKRLSVLSSQTIKHLETILTKAEELQTMSRLCSALEPDSLIVKKYSIKNLSSKELVEPADESYGYLKKVEGFRDHLRCMREENNLLKRERIMLMEENNRLKHSLKSYLVTVCRMPTIRPRTRA